MPACWRLGSPISKRFPKPWRGSLPAGRSRWRSSRRSIATPRPFSSWGGIHYAIAREGALKLKEASYVHAEGYPTGELKHGPNALVSDRTPLVVLATVDHASE